MELREALVQISQIRQQVAQTEMFRGYRAVPVAFSGGVALIAAGIQVGLIPEPALNIGAYIALWTGAAVLSILATGWEMAWHLRRSGSALEREKLFVAVSQFLPALVAGALLTIVLVRFASDAVWMLPGLWAVLFGLGIFASWRFLPPSIVWIGVWYLMAGLVTLIWAQGEAAFSPWAMGLPFGIGQLSAAAILYWTLERTDGQE